MAKIMLDPDEYDAAVEAYRDKYGYDDMSDEEKEAFDERLDQAVGRKEDDPDPSEDTDSKEEYGDTDYADDRSDTDKFRDEMKSKYGYDDMSDEQKQDFDDKLDQVLGGDSSDGEEEPDQHEKVLARRR